MVSTGGAANCEDSLDMDSDIEIPVEDLHLTSEHKHEDFVYTAQGQTFVPNMGSKQFKSTGNIAKQEQ